MSPYCLLAGAKQWGSSLIS